MRRAGRSGAPTGSATKLGGLLGRAVGARAGAGRPRTQQVEPLGQQILELRDRPALPQHVPVRTRRLLLLELRALAVGPQRLGAAARALPQRRDLGLGGEHQGEVMLPRAVVADLLTSRELDAGLVLEALGPETGALQRAISHCENLRHFPDDAYALEGLTPRIRRMFRTPYIAYSETFAERLGGEDTPIIATAPIPRTSAIPTIPIRSENSPEKRANNPGARNDTARPVVA